MTEHSLNEAVYAQIQELCQQGDALAGQRQFERAFSFYRDALNLIPEPVEDWEATTWVLAAIGDLYFLDRKFAKALAAFKDAVRCPGGLGNAFIHLRLGQCQFELGRRDRAADELTRAYLGAGVEVLEKEARKYLEFLKSRIQPPVGRRDL